MDLCPASSDGFAEMFPLFFGNSFAALGGNGGKMGELFRSDSLAALGPGCGANFPHGFIGLQFRHGFLVWLIKRQEQVWFGLDFFDMSKRTYILRRGQKNFYDTRR